MSLLDILSAAQGGTFFAKAGAAAGVSASTAESVIGKLAPAIATKLKDKAATDPEAFESLLDLLEDGDGSDLTDPDGLTDAEAQADGADILADIYGSAAQAKSTLGKLAPSGDAAALGPLSAISATAVLAALSASNVQTLSGSATQAASTSGGGGFFSILLAALLKGFMQSAQRQLAPKRRRRRYTSYYGQRRRRTTRRRRTSSVGLDDIFKDILGGRR